MGASRLSRTGGWVYWEGLGIPVALLPYWTSMMRSSPSQSSDPDREYRWPLWRALALIVFAALAGGVVVVLTTPSESSQPTPAPAGAAVWGSFKGTFLHIENGSVVGISEAHGYYRGFDNGTGALVCEAPASEQDRGVFGQLQLGFAHSSSRYFLPTRSKPPVVMNVGAELFQSVVEHGAPREIVDLMLRAAQSGGGDVVVVEPPTSWPAN